MKEAVCDKVRKSNACHCNHRNCYRPAHLPNQIGLKSIKKPAHKCDDFGGLVILATEAVAHLLCVPIRLNIHAYALFVNFSFFE